MDSVDNPQFILGIETSIDGRYVNLKEQHARSTERLGKVTKQGLKTKKRPTLKGRIATKRRLTTKRKLLIQNYLALINDEGEGEAANEAERVFHYLESEGQAVGMEDVIKWIEMSKITLRGNVLRQPPPPAMNVPVPGAPVTTLPLVTHAATCSESVAASTGESNDVVVAPRAGCSSASNNYGITIISVEGTPRPVLDLTGPAPAQPSVFSNVGSPDPVTIATAATAGEDDPTTRAKKLSDFSKAFEHISELYNIAMRMPEVLASLRALQEVRDMYCAAHKRYIFPKNYATASEARNNAIALEVKLRQGERLQEEEGME